MVCIFTHFSNVMKDISACFLHTRSILAYTNMVLLDANGFLAITNLSFLISLEVTFFACIRLVLHEVVYA